MYLPLLLGAAYVARAARCGSAAPRRPAACRHDALAATSCAASCARSLAVFAVIALVILLFTSVENLRRFGETGASAGDVLRITLLQAPEVLYQVFPLVLMLASLVTFLRFARTSELVVMRAAGVSALRLIAIPVRGGDRARRRSSSRWSTPSSPPRSSAAWRSRTSSATPARACSPSPAKASGCARPTPTGQTVIQAARTNADGTILSRVRMHRFDQRRHALRPPRGAGGAADARAPGCSRTRPSGSSTPTGRFERVAAGGRLNLPTDADQRRDPRQLRAARDRRLLGPRPLHRADGGIRASPASATGCSCRASWPSRRSSPRWC